MKKHNFLRKILNYIAFGIASILSPYVATAVFIMIISYSYSKDLSQFLPWMLSFFVFALVIPAIYVLWLMENKLVKDIHIADRAARIKPFWVSGISALAGAILLWQLHATSQVAVVATIYAINALGIALITQFWKISVHMALLSSIATMSVIIFGERFWWLYLLLIPLAWSRIYRQRHTPAQAAAGAMLTFVLTALGFWYFGYL